MNSAASSSIASKSKDKNKNKKNQNSISSSQESESNLSLPSKRSKLSISPSSTSSSHNNTSTNSPPSSSSSIPSSTTTSNSSSHSLASEHLRRVASSATLRASSTSTSSTPNYSRNRTYSRTPSLSPSVRHSLSLSPSSSALAKPSTSQINAQADSSTTSPSNLSLTSPSSVTASSNITSTPSTTSNTSSGSAGTIKQKPPKSQSQVSEMKRKSDSQDSIPTSTSTINPSTSASPTLDQKAIPSSHSRQRLAGSGSASAARPQTWFGRLGGGGSSAASDKLVVSETEVLSKEEEEFRKSLGLGTQGEMDEAQTLRNKRTQLDRSGNGNERTASASSITSANQANEDKDVVMEDVGRDGSDAERVVGNEGVESSIATLRPSKPSSSNAANRASWLWTRNTPIETASHISPSNLPSNEEVDETQLSEAQPQESSGEINTSNIPTSPVSVSDPTTTDEGQASYSSQFNTLRQSATAYASPLRRLWGGSSTAEESEAPSGKVSEDAKEELPTQTAMVSEPESKSEARTNQEDQAGWFWSRRAAAPPTPELLESSSSSLPPQIESTIQNGQVEDAASLPLAQTDSASYSANQGYSCSSYLASWIPTWRSENSEQTTSESQDVKMDSESETQPQTPAQKIRAEALARPESSSSLPLSPTANEAVLNSITRKGWVAYFSSKSANKPRSVLPIEDTPEVMDLDEDEPIGNGKAGNLSGTLTPKSAISTSKDSISSSVAAANNKAQPQASRSSLDGLIPSKIKSGPKGKQNSNQTSPSTKSNRSEIPTKDPAPPQSRPVTPLTNDKSAAKAIKKAAAANGDPNVGNGGKPPVRAPNLVLPTFEDTFLSPPRSLPPKAGVLTRTLAAVGSYLLSIPPDASRLRTAPRKRRTSSNTFSLGGNGDEDSTAAIDAMEQQQRLPRAWGVIGEKERESKRGCENVKKVVVIGVHGWFSQSIFKTVLGEPTGTSLKFVTMFAASVRKHFKEADMELNPEAVTVIPLQGDGRVGDRVDRLFNELLSRKEWVQDLRSADVCLIAAHSQGAIVSTHLLARLIEQKHLNSRKTKVCLLAMCGIHHGPFAHLKSTVTSSFINYFETAAAKELFEFQSSNAPVSKHYVASLNIALKAGVKFCYVASVDDQVVPLESALNSSSSHPSILRALYIDGQSFPRTDFLTNLLVFCVKVRNSGIGDHNLLTLLSSSVAGSLYSGLGHSLVYNESTVYDLATRYLLETNHPNSNPTTRSDESSPPELRTMAFEAQKWNPYSLPWALRGLLEDQDVRDLFEDDVRKLLSDYHEWTPTTKVLKDLQWRLEPMKMVKPSQSSNSNVASSSKAQDSGTNNNNSKL